MPATLLIKRLSNSGSDAGTWLRGEIIGVQEATNNWGPIESDINVFYRFTVTDKTVAEMRQYLARYTRDFEFTLINQNVDLRRYEVKNLWANTEGLGYWTQPVVDEIKLNWEERYPLADITTIGFPNTDVNGLGNIWDMSGEFPAGQGQEFRDVVTEAGRNLLDKRTVWYITEPGMVNIGNAGGVQSGTASQLNPILQDARLS